ncbi:MAG TPA: hypothetical protein VGC15_03470 [Acetobacteraceae bacterium]
MALYGCMISTQDYGVQRCTLGGGIALPFRCRGRGPSPRSPAALPDQHNRDMAAGLGYSDALLRDGVLRAAAAR